MTKKEDLMSIKQIAAEYPWSGPETTWRSRIRRDTAGIRGLCRKVVGSIYISRVDVERYLSGTLVETDNRQAKKPLYLFDLDGALAIRGFQANGPTIRLFESLHLSGAEILVWATRPSELADTTQQWVSNNLPYSWCIENINAPGKVLKLRDPTDALHSSREKEGWLHDLDFEDRGRLVAVFDGLDTAAQMWRRNGVACFQVAPGEF